MEDKIGEDIRQDKPTGPMAIETKAESAEDWPQGAERTAEAQTNGGDEAKPKPEDEERRRVLKELRKKDPAAAAKLQRAIKKKNARHRQAAARKIAAASAKKELPKEEVAEREAAEKEKEESMEEKEVIETSYVMPTTEEQIRSVQNMLRAARGLPSIEAEEAEKEADRSRIAAELAAAEVAKAAESSSDSSTESEGEDEDAAARRADRASGAAAAVAEDSTFAEFEAVFRNFQALGVRAAKKLAEGVVLDEEMDDLEESEEQKELRKRLEEEVRRDQEGVVETLPVSKRKGKQPPQQLSKRRLKELLRPPVAELKMQASHRPEVVDVWDTTAPDPFTLVWLKAYRNGVSVPIHWNQKRKYLSGKRAIEKPPFKLPDYIEATKIGQIRAAILEKDRQKTLKQRMREKSRPKSNRMHIDFQVLHDAFFKYASKPEMSEFSDVYYEGKEREEKTRQFRPGYLSMKIKEAVGMVLPTSPPPWLLTMQRYGAPTSYPNLKIPGINAPLPVGAQWGFHAGGWGKPPTDAFGNPLFPEVFADPTTVPVDQPDPEELGPPSYWGEFGEAVSEEEEEEEEEAEAPAPEEEITEEKGAEGPAEVATPVPAGLMDGTVTPSVLAYLGGTETPALAGAQSLVSSRGFTTPGAESTRALLGAQTPLGLLPPGAAAAGPQQLYQRLLPQPAASQAGLFPSQQTYQFPGAAGMPAAATGIVTPRAMAAGTASQISGISTPSSTLGGLMTPSALLGFTTPLRGAGAIPPIGAYSSTSSVQDFSPARIKEQLKQQEEIARKVTESERPTQSTLESAAQDKKQKKKKTFKF